MSLSAHETAGEGSHRDHRQCGTFRSRGLVPLLEALAKLRTERDVHLVVVGSLRKGGATEETLDRLDLNDAVEFVSDVAEPELVEIFGSAQVAVVPSLYEGFSLPAVELMSCATPLVATNAGALPEVVGPDGEAVLRVEPGDPQELAVALGRLLDDDELAARIGAAGRARVIENYMECRRRSNGRLVSPVLGKSCRWHRGGSC